jgi:hypothetical protein
MKGLAGFGGGKSNRETNVQAAQREPRTPGRGRGRLAGRESWIAGCKKMETFGPNSGGVGRPAPNGASLAVD